MIKWSKADKKKISKINKIITAILLGFIVFIKIGANIKNSKAYTKSQLYEQTETLHKNFTIAMNLKTIETKIDSNDKWVLYLGSTACGDCVALMSNVMSNVLEQNPSYEVLYIDYGHFGKKKSKWNKLLGQKWSKGQNLELSKGKIKDFTFKYTPTLVFIENGKAKFIFEDFGGGPKYKTRYYRWITEKEHIGYQNAIEDINGIIKSFKKITS